MVRRLGEYDQYPGGQFLENSELGMDPAERDNLFKKWVVERWKKFSINYAGFDTKDPELLKDIEEDRQREGELQEKWQAEKESRGDRENPMGEYFEYALAQGIHAENWLGDQNDVPQVEVVKTSEGDDHRRQTDLALIFTGEDGQPISLAVDAVCTDNPAIVREKINRNFKAIARGYLPAELKFFQSEDFPELDRRQKMPRVVIGVTSSEGKKLLEMFAGKIKKRNSRLKRSGQLNTSIEEMTEAGEENNDWISQTAKEQIQSQLAASLELAVAKLVGSVHKTQSKEISKTLEQLRRYREKLKANNNVPEEAGSQDFLELVKILKNQEPAIREASQDKPALAENIYRHLEVLDHVLKNIPKKTSSADQAGEARESRDAVHESLVVANKEHYHDLF